MILVWDDNNYKSWICWHYVCLATGGKDKTAAGTRDEGAFFSGVGNGRSYFAAIAYGANAKIHTLYVIVGQKLEDLAQL